MLNPLGSVTIFVHIFQFSLCRIVTHMKTQEGRCLPMAGVLCISRVAKLHLTIELAGGVVAPLNLSLFFILLLEA